jgi:hypothetical protein
MVGDPKRCRALRDQIGAKSFFNSSLTLQLQQQQQQ